MADIDRNHELTMLYLSNQDLGNIEPKDLVLKYRSVYEEIRQALKETAKKAKVQSFNY